MCSDVEPVFRSPDVYVKVNKSKNELTTGRKSLENGSQGILNSAKKKLVS